MPRWSKDHKRKWTKEYRRAMHRTYSKNWREKNIGKVTEYWRAYIKTHRSERKNHKLQYRYGLSLTDYNALLKTQGGRCAICQQEQQLNVDHCSITGKIRGLLCLNCNLGIGYLYHNQECLKRAARYLADADTPPTSPQPFKEADTVVSSPQLSLSF